MSLILLAGGVLRTLSKSPAKLDHMLQGSLNEVQSGAADNKKMITSSDTKLPVVKQAEKAIKNMKKD
jgi:hypothetical protein